MFTSFSWSGYLLFVSTVLFSYFIIIGILYYKKEILRVFTGRKDPLQEMIDRPVKHLADPLRMVHELVSELGILIAKAAEDKMIQPELLYAMKQFISNYLILSSTEFYKKINLYIESDYEGLWKP
jgi:hypothetical protein